MAEPIRIAFVKFGGLASGGTERWLQMMAANLDRDRFAVDYFYCDAAPYIGSDFRHPDTDLDRLEYMKRAGVNLVKFSVGAKDIRTPTHDWVDTDFWQLFDEGAYDLVQTAKAGPAEYPYHRMKLPVLEYLTLNAGVDRTANIVLSIHLSQWQRRQWAAQGGDLGRSDVIYVPAEPPASTVDLRDELGIPPDAVVAGFHQRAQDEIFSPIPLRAFGEVHEPGRWFVMMGGGPAYRRQAKELGLRDVVFLDHRGAAGRISQFLNTLDVFAHGRRDGETFGAVFAEAMMHGRPCLSHRSDIANAQPETMGPAGLFAEDAGEYATALGWLFSDSELRARLAAKARPHAERYYSLASCVQRLEDAYGRVLTGAAPKARRPVSYGKTDLGFLVAGDVDDVGRVAHCVVTGGIPGEPVLDLLGQLLATGAVAAFREAGTADTVLAPAAAHAGVPAEVHTTEGVRMDGLLATVDLNNWEERFQVVRVGGAESVDAERLGAGGLAAVNDPEWAERLAPALLARTPRPGLLLRLGAATTVLGDLRSAGYRYAGIRAGGLGRRAGPGGWYVAVHPGEHSELHAVLGPWTARRRRRTAGQAIAAPGKAVSRRLAHARPVIGRILGR